MGPAPLDTLYYGSRFTCRAAAPPGVYLVRLSFVEPNATAAGQRRFTITVNGQVSDPIDVFAAVGARPTGLRLDTTAISYFGFIKIEFVGLMVGITQVNAIVNAIEVYPAFTGPILAASYLCTEPQPVTPDPANPVPSCTGLRAVVFKRPDGSLTDPYAIVPVPALDARWSIAPIP